MSFKQVDGMKELAKKIYKKTEKRLGANTGKIVTVILFGVLLLVAVIPADGCSINADVSSDSILITEMGTSATKSTEAAANQTYTDDAQYYEERLKNILETSYGKDSVTVMVHMVKNSTQGLYGNVSEESVIDGVLVVADVASSNDLLLISEAVCALFDLPACKVYVIKKS
jgi:hypothetical protein